MMPAPSKRKKRADAGHKRPAATEGAWLHINNVTGDEPGAHTCDRPHCPDGRRDFPGVPDYTPDSITQCSKCGGLIPVAADGGHCMKAYLIQVSRRKQTPREMEYLRRAIERAGW